MTLREELGKVLENFGSLYDDNVAEYIVKHRVKEAITAIEKLIDEKYVEKPKLTDKQQVFFINKWDAETEEWIEQGLAPFTFEQLIEGYITRQEAYEKALGAFNRHAYNEDHNATSTVSIDETLFNDDLRTAFKIPEGKE